MKYFLTPLGTFALTLQQLCSEGVSTTLNLPFFSSSSSSSSSYLCHGSSGHLVTHKMLSYRIWKNTNIKLSSGYKLWQGRGGKRDWRDGGDSDGDYVYQRNEQDEGYCVEDGPDYPPRRKQAQPSTWFGGKFHDERQRHYETPQYHYADDVDPWPSCAPESKNGELQSHLRHMSSGFAVDNTQDIVSEYESSSVIHRATIIVSSGLVGSLAGAILAESLFGRIHFFALIGLVLGIVTSFSKSIFGEMIRALGLGGVFAFQRCGQLCFLYPMFPYVKALLGLGPRIPFPPGPDPPWKYRGGQGMPPFSMTRTLLALLFLGGFGGYTFSKMTSSPLPLSIMALSTGGGTLWIGTLEGRLGDLFRLIGIRLVGLIGVLAEVNSEVLATAKIVASFRSIVKALLFWDQKFELTDKFMAILSHLVGHLSSAITALMAESKATVDDDYGVEPGHSYDGHEQRFGDDFGYCR
eukprot:503324_1